MTNTEKRFLFVAWSTLGLDMALAGFDSRLCIAYAQEPTHLNATFIKVTHLVKAPHLRHFWPLLVTENGLQRGAELCVGRKVA